MKELVSGGNGDSRAISRNLERNPRDGLTIAKRLSGGCAGEKCFIACLADALLGHPSQGFDAVST